MTNNTADRYRTGATYTGFVSGGGGASLELCASIQVQC
jgi:hypothetical protein